MLFVNYKIKAPKDLVLKNLSDNERLIEEEKYDTSNGTPKLHVKQNGDKIKIGCEMMGRATKDNGFLEGTKLRGTITEHDGITTVKGVIITAPIYHAFLLLLFAFFIYRCITLGGISVTPIILLVFSIFMFAGEFKKQGIIKRFLFRALKITYRELNQPERRTGESASQSRETSE